MKLMAIKNFIIKKIKKESPTKFIEKGKIYILCQKDARIKGEDIIKVVLNGQIWKNIQLLYF